MKGKQAVITARRAHRARPRPSCAGRVARQSSRRIGLVGGGNPAAMANHFPATLGGGLWIQLLLRVRCADCRPNRVAGAHRERIADLLYPPHRRGD
jgi:hypothetical protein